MRIVLTENCTVDGVIDLSSGWFDPAQQDDDLTAELRRHMAEEDGLLLGRATFEAFREYWPSQHHDTSGIRSHLDQVPKYVVSTTLNGPGWANTEILRTSPVEAVRHLGDAQGRNLGVTGSISVAHQIVAADLVDEYRLFVYPIVVGRGARLFPDETERIDLKLIETKSFPSGVTLQRYERRR